MGEDKKQEAMRKALMEFVQSIDNVGGVILLSNGLHVPVIDEDWIDLGEAYVEACKALGRGRGSRSSTTPKVRTTTAPCR